MTATPEQMTALYSTISNLDYAQITLVAGALRDQSDVLRRRAHRENMLSMKVGSRVRIVPNIKPKYLGGMTGEVTSLADGKVHVRLDRGPYRKFTSGQVTFRTAASLEVIES